LSIEDGFGFWTLPSLKIIHLPAQRRLLRAYPFPMLDTHTIPKEAWGVYPYLHVGPFVVPSYSLCVTAGVLIGIWLYFDEIRRSNSASQHTPLILIVSFVGGILGAKLPYLAWNVSLYLHGVRDPEILFSGRTILGGLIGGTLAVRLVKWRLNLYARKGDYLVPGIAAGLVFGRIGCFLRGCCCGTETLLPWGINFGDGIRRHPTELYEAAFCLAWFIYARLQTKTDTGRMFDRFMLSYFAARFLLEFIRTESVAFAGLTLFQLVCLPVICWVLHKLINPQPQWTHPTQNNQTHANT
jgi:prolipoprotein diacylglyceryltransferase